MTHPEPLRGPDLRSALAAILARPITELPRPDRTEGKEAIKANGRKAAALMRAASKPKAPRKSYRVRTGRGTCKGRPKFDHAEALAKARDGVTPKLLAAEYGVSTKAIQRMLNKLWPDRPKRGAETENGI